MKLCDPKQSKKGPGTELSAKALGSGGRSEGRTHEEFSAHTDYKGCGLGFTALQASAGRTASLLAPRARPPPSPRARPTFAALRTQVLSDVVVHAHVLLEHVLTGEGLPALLARVTLHACRAVQRETLEPSAGGHPPASIPETGRLGLRVTVGPEGGVRMEWVGPGKRGVGRGVGLGRRGWDRGGGAGE